MSMTSSKHIAAVTRFLAPIQRAVETAERSSGATARLPSSLPASAELQLTGAPPGVDDFLLDVMLRSEQAERSERVVMAIRMLAARRTPAARLGLMTFAARSIDLDTDSTAYTALANAIGELAEEYMPEVLGFLRHHEGDLGLLPQLAATAHRLSDTLMEVLLARLDDNPRSVAPALWNFEDKLAVAPLLARLARLPPGDTHEWALTALELADAIAGLGGRLTKDQKALVRLARELRRAWWSLQDAERAKVSERLEEAQTCVRRHRLDELACHASYVVRVAVAENEVTAEATLASLAADGSVEVRCAVAGNRRAPDAAQLALASDLHFDVRLALARCCDLYPAACAVLIADPDDVLRSELAESLPVSMIDAALRDPAMEVRRALAHRRDLLAVHLDTLASDENPAVRREVVHHPNVPLGAIRRLSKDHDPATSTSARERLKQMTRDARGASMGASYRSHDRL